MMSDAKPPYRLLAPGPVPVPPPVLKAMSDKVLHHRTPEFQNILKKAWSGLKTVFATKQPVQILAGTGSAAMEAAVVNFLSPGDQVLVVDSGKFGERWAEICEAYGIRTHRLKTPWGQPVNLAQFESTLKEHRAVKMVFSQVCETSTATVHPIQKMAQIVASHTSALFAVDAITAVGAMPLPMDEWNLDIVVGGSQKAFMIPTGLSFLAASEKAWRQNASARLPRFYLDLAAERKANEKGDTNFSSPTPLLVGLAMVVGRIQDVGLDLVIRRCANLAEATRSAAQALGLELYSQAPSDSVTAIKTPNGVNSSDVRDWLERERNITVMGGQNDLKGRILRIGHMGHILNGDMQAFFVALAEALDRSKDVQRAQDVLSQKLKNEEILFP
ncbi:MAG: alanine--glyoxylate aminotransferase family protein [Bdellovibrionales bacterium]